MSLKLFSKYYSEFLVTSSDWNLGKDFLFETNFENVTEKITYRNDFLL